MINRIIMCGILLLSGNAFGECRTATSDEFAGLLTPSVKKIVFFASWCKSCQEHMTADFVKESIFVAAFDQKAAAEKVLQRFFPDGAQAPPCVFDGDERLVKQYHVKYLPFVIKL